MSSGVKSMAIIAAVGSRMSCAGGCERGGRDRGRPRVGPGTRRRGLWRWVAYRSTEYSSDMIPVLYALLPTNLSLARSAGGVIRGTPPPSRTGITAGGPDVGHVRVAPATRGPG